MLAFDGQISHVVTVAEAPDEHITLSGIRSQSFPLSLDPNTLSTVESYQIIGSEVLINRTIQVVFNKIVKGELVSIWLALDRENGNFGFIPELVVDQNGVGNKFVKVQ